jgi:hypothetical protein
MFVVNGQADARRIILYMHVDVSVFKRTIFTSWFVNLYGYLWKIK